jgi:hypothetical protein
LYDETSSEKLLDFGCMVVALGRRREIEYSLDICLGRQPVTIKYYRNPLGSFGNETCEWMDRSKISHTSPLHALHSNG